MKVTEIIKKRKACRTFKQEALKPADRKSLETFIKANNKSIGNESIDLVIVDKGTRENKMKLDYGIVQGHNIYILGKAKSNRSSRVNYGYLMEKVVLKATELNIASCWIGYFDESYFNEFKPKGGYEIPGIVIIGYSKERKTLKDMFLRLTVKAYKRHPWGKLFFNYQSREPLTPEAVKKYSDSLEMVRLAPSSGNSQPWRIFFDDDAKEFHFYKKAVSKMYEAKGLHDIDMGIAMAHFELTSHYNRLKGIWKNYGNKKSAPFTDMQYIMTWKCE